MTYYIGRADNLAEAHQIASDEAFTLLTRDWGLDAYPIVLAVVPDRS